MDRAVLSPNDTIRVPAEQIPDAGDDLVKTPSGPGSDNSGVAEPTPARATPVHSVTKKTQVGDDPKVNAEFDRFAQVAEPMPRGGLYCPVYGIPQMPSGVPGEQWDEFIRDCDCLGKRRKT
ncbi:MAG: hypothetical protein O7D91_15980 [Planctomycetota bacterium]|nr:hypothetical protein [Planctomycetota bacterium]